MMTHEVKLSDTEISLVLISVNSISRVKKPKMVSDEWLDIKQTNKQVVVMTNDGVVDTAYL